MSDEAITVEVTLEVKQPTPWEILTGEQVEIIEAQDCRATIEPVMWVTQKQYDALLPWVRDHFPRNRNHLMPVKAHHEYGNWHKGMLLIQNSRGYFTALGVKP